LQGYFGGGSAIPEDTMTRGLVGYWSFDEGKGGIANDKSGNGNTGKLGNGIASAQPKWTQGKSSGALQFDGKNDYVDAGNDASLNITDAITIEAWVKAIGSSTGITPGIVCKRDNGFGLIWMDQGENYVNARIYQSNGTQINTNSFEMSQNVWHHIVLTASNNDKKVRIYLDTIEKGTAKDYDGTIKTGNGILYVGQQSNQSFNGTIDEVRIYNRALSAEEVRYHYNHGGPVAAWDMDEGSGTKINDQSGNHNDGTISGATWTSGKYGSALQFDGVNDYAQATVAQTKTTYSLWVKNGAVWEYVVNNNGVYYVNGKRGTPTTYPIYVNGNTVQLGKSGASTFVNCQIDDVKIYNYARTADEIRLDYQAGLATHFGPSGKTCSEDPASCMDYGLAGYWDMDEGKGGIANDKSGNGNTGKLGNGTASAQPKWTQGKEGSALQFDGKNDYVDCGNDASLNITDAITIEAWVKPNVTYTKNSPVMNAWVTIVDKGYTNAYLLRWGSWYGAGVFLMLEYKM